MRVNFNGTPGEYTYAQGQFGKSAEGIVSVGSQSERNASVQQSAGGNDREAGDHGGHLIAHSLGGKNDETNIDAQAANVNQTAIENEGVDSKQDVGMTAEQRSIANELSGAENYVDDRVGSGWQVTHFDNSEYMGSLESDTREISSEDEYAGSVETSISTEGESQDEDDSISMD